MLTGSLADAFELLPGEVVSIVGAGGKTSLLIGLARELRDRGWRVLVTTTTRLAADQLDYFPARVEWDEGLDAIGQALDAHGCVIVYDELDGGKARGIAPERVETLRAALHPDAILVEADGARGLPLKFSRQHEPVIAAGTTRIIVCMDYSGVGHPYETHVYNVEELLRRFTMLKIMGDLINPTAFEYLGFLETFRASRAMQTKPAPLISLFVNRFSGVRGWDSLFETANPLTQPQVDRLVGGRLQYRTEEWHVDHVRRKVIPIVLAAGMARRMGEMKVLLPWGKDDTILDHILKELHLGHRLSAVVVTGHEADAVNAIARRRYAGVVHNPDFAAGDMLSSMKAGLRAMPAGACAALVVLGDQPLLRWQTVRAIVTAYQEDKGRIVAPSYQMRRGHPILIDRQYWDEILALPDDGAPRDVINRHADATHYVLVDDDAVLVDVDTPEQYQAARRRAGLDP